MSLPKLLESLPKGVPRFVEPMKCRLMERLPEAEEWVYEIKFDGYRGVAIKNKKKVELISRNGKSLAGKFPEVAEALGKLRCEQLVLDGELVALDGKGRSAFQLLQTSSETPANLFYYGFDILHLNGRDVTGLPLMKRKALLKTVLQDQSECIRFSDVLPGSAEELEAAMRPMGLEGLIAKKRDSRYEPGQRSGAWVKFKWGYEQEFVIGGYTDPEGSRPYFGSVVVGYYEGKRLLFAGKVGTGLNAKLLKSLYDKFQKIRVEKCPFANLPERGAGLTAGQMKFCKWIEPRLVCQVRFTEWTRDGHLRQPVFLGLRDDKSAAEVVREAPNS